MSKSITARRGRLLCGAAAVSSALALAMPPDAFAQSNDETVGQQLNSLKAQLAAQAEQLARQEAELAAQQQKLSEQDQKLLRARSEYSAWKAQGDGILASLRAAGYNVIGPVGDVAGASPGSNAPTRVAEAAAGPGPAPGQAAVGEAPPEQPQRTVIAATPQEASVLTQKGRLVVEPSAEYTLTSSNILVFRGVEIVPGIQLGVIEASNTVRALEALTETYRFGVTHRLEVEAQVPFLWRQDRITVVQQRDQQVTRELSLNGYGLGDVEFGARYQLNAIRPDHPIFIAGLQVKSDTGSNPYLVRRDQFGVESQLATGSGFWGVQPSLTALYPTDPAVLFGSVSYMHNFGKALHQDISGVLLNRVDPGDSIGATAGFGFSVNSRFAYSVAYKYNYIFPTTVDLGGSLQKSHNLQVGTVVLGLSYRLNDHVTLAGSVEIGTTADAPDTHITLRIPFA